MNEEVIFCISYLEKRVLGGLISMKRRGKKMKLYIQIENENINNVDVEENQICNVEVEANTLDEMFIKLEEYGKLDEEIESKISDLFENETERESVTAYNIKHWVSNRSFGELIDMFNCGEIKKPAMQREFVWDAQKSSRLVESIILGLPIPPLFLLEVGNNEYELIDGFQRLTTVANYVNGDPWNIVPSGKKKRKSKLSGKIMKELIGKSFDQLAPEYQRIIKRSTIPLIEFRQIGPEDYSSKYLIFERINTGSVKLNSMQIRKSLAYGDFITSLYETADSCNELKSIFSNNALKKDAHVEAILRIIAMSDIYYNKYKVEKSGINNILNNYCEKNKNKKIEKKYIMDLSKAMKTMYAIFEDKKYIFRKVEKKKKELIFVGNLNVSILEAMLGVTINKKVTVEKINAEEIRNRYMETMYEILEKSFNREEENPFSISTGTPQTIHKRFEICERILGCR